ncbi:MAG: methylenetetrahydrofolate reductase [NAD(P)H] [Inquilinus sp.]|nr:methylenetetrahydrofolate reductase [NAD(P)H] [Inquilinus sp.]
MSHEQPDPGSAPVRVSVEFFPPRSPQMETTLRDCATALQGLAPAFASVTDGALASDSEMTPAIVLGLAEETSLDLAAHMTCVARDRAATEALARTYWRAGIRRIVALRGDRADAGPYRPDSAHYAYAVDLVDGLRRVADFEISVAAYPEVHPDAPSAAYDLDNLKRKLDAGATRAITQFFFDNSAFLRFRDRARTAGIEAPIVPGILPVTNFERAAEFARRCGTRVPDDLAGRFAGVADSKEARRQAAVDFAVDQGESLRAHGVDAFHFYTLNRAEPTVTICRHLGIAPASRAVRAVASAR